VDQAGNVYVNDTGNRRIRQIGRDGIIRTLAGTGTQGFSGDGGPATSAAIGRDVGMAIDATGAMYLADAANNRIRRISPRAPQSPPEFTSAAVVNAASFASGLVPGALATIFGRNLSPASGAVVTSQVPWPARLNGVAVSVGGMPARLYSQATIAGQEQISFQVPFEVASSGNVPVVVENNGATSTSVSVPVRAAMPGVFLIDGSNGAFLHANFSPVTPANPAMRGEVLLLYLTGLGAVSPAVATGTPGPASEPLARTTATPVVTIGGQIADVLYSGIAPGFVGLYQLNLRVPATAPSGAVDIEVRVGETAGNAAKLQVQ
jgi:uncharacterized protein (TIGR03437 family)